MAAAVIPELDDRGVSANTIVMAALRGGHPEERGVSDCNWMAGSSPAMTAERKFANVFMISYASGNIGAIKSRKGEALFGIESRLALRLAGMTAPWRDQRTLLSTLPHCPFHDMGAS